MAPTSPGGYCRQCGARTAVVVPVGDNRPRSVCGQCGAIEYDNPKVVVACPLYEGDRILWIRRRTAPYAGCWAIPSGFLENGETLREAACRELLEETRLHVRPEDLVLYGALSLPDMQEIYIALVAPLPSHDYGTSAEASEVAMIAREEVESLDLGYPEPTKALLLGVYDVIARGELDRLSARLWDIRGFDPAAHDRS
jgi:ADP-ribose pyrophosphatase YjhB (NUDIX family)